jgi:hypothetical protein
MKIVSHGCSFSALLSNLEKAHRGLCNITFRNDDPSLHDEPVCAVLSDSTQRMAMRRNTREMRIMHEPPGLPGHTTNHFNRSLLYKAQKLPDKGILN